MPALRNGSLSSFAKSLPRIHESAAFPDFIAWGPLSFLTWEKLRNKLAVYQAYYLKGAMWKATFL